MPNEQPSSASPTSVRYVTLALVAAASSSAYLTRYCIGAANTTIARDLQLSEPQMGWIMSAFAFGYFLCQVPGGWLGDRLGTRTSLPVLSVLWSLLTLWSSLVFSFVPMLASRMAFGLAQAGLVPNTAKVIKDWIPLERRGIASAFITAAMSIGGVATMWLTGVLLEVTGWRAILQLYSLVGIVWAIVFYLVFRTKPAQHPWVNVAEVNLITKPSQQQQQTVSVMEMNANSSPRDVIEDAADDPAIVRPAGSGNILLEMSTSLSMWGICLQSFFRAAGYGFFVTWFPGFLEYAYGMSPEDAPKMTMWPLLGVVIGAMCGGLLVDWLLRITGSKWISRSGVAFVSLAACGLLMLLSSQAATVTQMIAFTAVGAGISGLASPSAWAATMDVAGKHTAVVVGTMNMAGCVAGFVLPAILGYLIGDIRETGGDWNIVIYIHVAIYWLGAICWLVVNPNRTLAND